MRGITSCHAVVMNVPAYNQRLPCHDCFSLDEGILLTKQAKFSHVDLSHVQYCHNLSRESHGERQGEQCTKIPYSAVGYCQSASSSHFSGIRTYVAESSQEVLCL